ncbi:hypothetical protein TWF106_002090 [Orbilia oligospora]|uniref:Uncharacterized protein n=1 Tax=Orbilia oligospora TaxID=2813651 RepID=A0A6G1MI53_ORBOL|nr:hypothetical protein TWF106_002090 [Orbilia oligospora]KAF3206675.1 hypothetical protein TWF191_001394 [Orbilia oligospora]KAF3259572.1 hypothetical protein TWF192_010434 [Orbilia oligospora]
MRLLLIYEDPMYGARSPNLDDGKWPPPTANPSVTIRKFEAFASFRQRNILCHVRNLEILSYTPDAIRNAAGDVIIEHRMGVFVSKWMFQGSYNKEFYTDTSINELVNAMKSMTGLTSLYMHTDFLKYLEAGQLSLDFLSNTVKSFKIVSKSHSYIFPSSRFYSNLVTLKAHPVLLSKARQNGLVNLPNLKNLVVYGGRPKGSRQTLNGITSTMPPLEPPPFNLEDFLAAQESPFALTSLSLKTLEQNFPWGIIAYPENINSILFTPYLSNLRRLHIDSFRSDAKIDPDHIWNVFRVNNIHLEDLRLKHVSTQLISYLGSYRDTLKSLQIGLRVRHLLNRMLTPTDSWNNWQQLGTRFWRDVISAHSSTLRTLRTKPIYYSSHHVLRQTIRTGQNGGYYSPDVWSLANNPAAQKAIEGCEQLEVLAVFSIDNGDRPFEQVIGIMLKHPKLHRFTFYNDYCTGWEYPAAWGSDEFYSGAHKLLQDALKWSGSEEIEINDGFRRKNPLEIELYPAGKLKTYFDWNRMAWMLVQVWFDRKEPKEGEIELDLDEEEIDRAEKLFSASAGSVCRDPLANG